MRLSWILMLLFSLMHFGCSVFSGETINDAERKITIGDPEEIEDMGLQKHLENAQIEDPKGEASRDEIMGVFRMLEQAYYVSMAIDPNEAGRAVIRVDSDIVVFISANIDQFENWLFENGGFQDREMVYVVKVVEFLDYFDYPGN